jgi:CubicO group peptidase (beta-lactamase class C family)
MKHLLGHHQARWEPLAHAFDALFERGDDLGASLALTVEGELVLDHWGGWCDEARTRPWDRNTLTHVWSTTKTMTSLCALLLADQGELDLDAPVAAYWPEFAANGKSGIRVRDVLGHTSGVSGWEQPMDMGDLCDWERSTALLAAQPPWWRPGSASGYHALNYGHLVGELIRRITGQKTGAFLADELAGPLGADFHIGLPPELDGRVARVVPPPPAPVDFSAIPPDSPMTGAGPTSAPPTATAMRARWPSCSPSSPARAAWPGGAGSSRRPWPASSRCRPAASTSCWACRCAWAWAMDCPSRPRCPSSPSSASASGAAGVGRWCSSTSSGGSASPT